MDANIVIIALSFTFCLPTIWFTSRFNMHMLQLNTYINSEHFGWLSENLRKVWLLFALMFLGLLQVFFQNWTLDIVSLLFLVLTYFIFKAMKRIYSKKPLHFTPRVKRMFVCDYVICAMIIFLVFCLLGIRALPGAFSFICGAQMLLVPFANLVNSPIEKAIRNKYINEAKAILKKCENLVVIGVAGSYGKTSVKFYLGELLSSKYNVLVTPESYNTPMGIVKTIRESLSVNHDFFICEMGARYVGEIKEICDIVHPDHGIITSVGPAHLSTFGSLENIQKTKFELADAVLEKEGKMFINIDSPLLEEHASKRKLSGIKDDFVTFSNDENSGADFTSLIEQVGDNGTTFNCLKKGAESQEFHSRLVGSHNVINLTAGVSVANNFGCSLSSLVAPLRKIKAVPHRMELKQAGHVTIIDDAFNSNPIGSKAALETLSLFNAIKILVTPGMVELGEDEEKYNFEFGQYAAKNCDWIILVGKLRTLPIKNGALSQGFDQSKIESYNTFEEAINFAYKIKDENKRSVILLENDLPDNYFSAA